MSKLRGGVCDTRCQQFHREVARKEEKLKLMWFLKNQQRLYDSVGKKFSESIEEIQQKKKKFTDDRETKEIVKEDILPSWRPKDAELVDLMRPIKPEIRDILFVPKDESFMSKKKYFRERYKQKPEDRFYFPYCSSWIFGWRLKDHPLPVVSEYGRRSVIQSSFYRRNASSLQRDPDWYRMCQTNDPKNFNELLSY